MMLACLRNDADCTLQEVEDTLVEFLEKGATVESDILANVKSILPKEAADQLDALIPSPPIAQSWDAQSYQQQGGWSGGAGVEEEEIPVIYTADASC
jgi:hypothetical protein